MDSRVIWATLGGGYFGNAAAADAAAVAADVGMGTVAAIATDAGNVGIGGGNTAAGGIYQTSASAGASVGGAGVNTGEVVVAQDDTSGTRTALDIAVAAASLGLDAAGAPTIGLALQIGYEGSKGGIDIPQSTLEHIVGEHWPTSGVANKGQFLRGTTARGLRDVIRQTLAKGSVKPNTRGRPGTIYEHDFGQPIVFNRAGGLSSQLRVVVRNGVVVYGIPLLSLRT